MNTLEEGLVVEVVGTTVLPTFTRTYDRSEGHDAVFAMLISRNIRGMRVDSIITINILVGIGTRVERLDGSKAKDVSELVGHHQTLLLHGAAWSAMAASARTILNHRGRCRHLVRTPEVSNGCIVSRMPKGYWGYLLATGDHDNSDRASSCLEGYCQTNGKIKSVS